VFVITLIFIPIVLLGFLLDKLRFALRKVSPLKFKFFNLVSSSIKGAESVAKITNCCRIGPHFGLHFK